MKKYLIPLAVILFFIFVFIFRSQPSTPNNQLPDSSPQLTFFYGVTCPHCQDVEDWLKENNVETKVKIVKKEVYQNQANSLELQKAAQKCGLDTNNIGVPFLFTADSQCLVGTPQITQYLAAQLESQ